MNREEMDALVRKWEKHFNPVEYKKHFQDTQYDDRSAMINYTMIREHKPKTVLEFGAHKGRCTRDILQALLDNAGKFKFQSFEIDDDLRRMAQAGMDKEFGDKAIVIGGDVKEGKINKGIDYLFIDNSHDLEITKWVFDYLLPNHCKKGCLVQIHDLRLKDNWKDLDRGTLEEEEYIRKLHKSKKLPLEKIYWNYEEGDMWESTWWRYR